MKIQSIKTYISTLAITSLLIYSCGSSGGGSDDSPPPPPENVAPNAVASVIFPTANLICIDNNINFDWNDVTDPDGDTVSYEVTIAENRALSQNPITRNSNSSQVTVTLARNTAYYWSIKAIDNQNNESAASPTLAFFTEGDGVTNTAPFTAEIGAPIDNTTNVTSGTVSLSWIGADADDDASTLTYDVYFGTSNTPELLTEGTGITETTFDVDAPNAATTYFWRIDTIDPDGAKSIGQVWQFTTN